LGNLRHQFLALNREGRRGVVERSALGAGFREPFFDRLEARGRPFFTLAPCRTLGADRRQPVRPRRAFALDAFDFRLDGRERGPLSLLLVLYPNRL
jgi:hypothetical protein